MLNRDIPLRLSDIVGHQGFKFKRPNSSRTEETTPGVIEQDLTDWGNWNLKDKTWIKRYISKEQTRQEDLLLRNALVNIEKEMSGANMIKRHQIRQKLQVEKEREEIEKKKAEASFYSQYNSPVITINIPTETLPVSTPSNVQSPISEIMKESAKVNQSKKEKVFPRPQRTSLSKALDEIDKSVNGLSVIAEHPAVAKKRKETIVV